MELTEEMLNALIEWKDARGKDADRDRTRHEFLAMLEIVRPAHEKEIEAAYNRGWDNAIDTEKHGGAWG